jgi:hypothetical protein
LDIEKPIAELPASPGRPAEPRLEIRERSTELVFGERKLRALIPAIQQLRRECGQEDDLTTDPQYFIAANTLSDRSVAAVLIRKDRALEACVLFYEHCRFGLGLGLFRGGGILGESLAIGPETSHVQYIHLATQSLLRRWRIHGVSLSVRASADRCAEIMGAQDQHRISCSGEICYKLPLASTYQEMLAGMGPRTRRSLASKRRQLEARARIVFVPDLEPALTLEAMLSLQSRSLPNRVTGFYHARYHLLEQKPGFFSMGIRFPDGDWLSLLSGWRQKHVTYVDLQMNDMHFKKESVSAVMRAFMLEHEIVYGQQLINFVGGTSMLLRRYCRPVEPSTEIFVWRPCLRASLFKMIIPRIKAESVYERIKII